MTELEQFRTFVKRLLGTTYGLSDAALAGYAKAAKSDVENSVAPWSWRTIAAERLRKDHEPAGAPAVQPITGA